MQLEIGMQEFEGDDLEPGQRVRLTPLGVQRCPKFKSYTGVVVGVAKRGRAYRVQLDGRSMPTMLHESYIEPE